MPDISGLDISLHHHLQSLRILNSHPTTFHNLLKTTTQQSMLEDITWLLPPHIDLLSPHSWSDPDQLLGKLDSSRRSMQLNIRFTPSEGAQEKIENIKSCLPLCHARGILHIIAEAVPIAGQFEGFITQTWRDPALGEAAEADVRIKG